MRLSNYSSCLNLNEHLWIIRFGGSQSSLWRGVWMVLPGYCLKFGAAAGALCWLGAGQDVPLSALWYWQPRLPWHLLKIKTSTWVVYQVNMLKNCKGMLYVQRRIRETISKFSFVNPLRFICVSLHIMDLWNTLCQCSLVWWMTDIFIYYPLYEQGCLTDFTNQRNFMKLFLVWSLCKFYKSVYGTRH